MRGTDAERRDERDDVDERRDRRLRSRAYLPAVSRKKPKPAVLGTHSDRSTTNRATRCLRLSAFPTRALALLDASTHRAWVRGIVHRGHEHDVRVFVEQVLRSVAARAHRAGGVVHQHGDAAPARHEKMGVATAASAFFKTESSRASSGTGSCASDAARVWIVSLELSVKCVRYFGRTHDETHKVFEPWSKRTRIPTRARVLREPRDVFHAFRAYRPHRLERSRDRHRDALDARAPTRDSRVDPRRIASWRERRSNAHLSTPACTGRWCPARIPDAPSRRRGSRTPEVRRSRVASGAPRGLGTPRDARTTQSTLRALRVDNRGVFLGKCVHRSSANPRAPLTDCSHARPRPRNTR